MNSYQQPDGTINKVNPAELVNGLRVIQEQAWPTMLAAPEAIFLPDKDQSTTARASRHARLESFSVSIELTAISEYGPSIASILWQAGRLPPQDRTMESTQNAV